jgi:acetyltransferase-like isoleucine patch superfamily enzyme
MSFRKRLIAYLLRPFKKDNITYSFDVVGIEHLNALSPLNVPVGCIFSGNIQIGKHSTFGPRCFFRGEVEIGNYCQFGADVSFHSRNHPMEYLSTYQNSILFEGRLKTLRTDKKITVGHDVWIGHGAIILSGVTIGNGAIIAAGAIVQKDVAPFAIVAGVPAKLIRYRFSEDNISKINKLNWWALDPEEISKMEDQFFKKYT